MLSNLTAVFNTIIYLNQYGFRCSKFTTTNLLVYYTDFVENFQIGGQVDVVYTDLRKVFDVVDFD